MIRALFIGLLIISTMANEGVINIPGNLYNFLVCAESSSRPIIESVSAGKAFKESTGTSAVSYQLSRLHGMLLSANSVKKFASKVHETSFVLFNSEYSTHESVITKDSCPFFQNKKVILKKSDLSPPFSL